MALPVANLDDRTFQDIVNEARRRIPLYCPEWTDHNLSDPGITLIELFAWMTEMMIYRMNKVPDNNYVKFLEMIGVELNPAAPASADITMRVSGPQLGSVTIPIGTEVATLRTETDESIVFTTTENLTIHPATLSHFLLSQNGESFDDRLQVLRDWENLRGLDGAEGRMFAVFSDVPEADNSFYMCFDSDIRRSILSLRLEFAERGAPGVVPSNPPVAWEYWDSEESNWVVFGKNQESDAWLESDGTRGFNTRGNVVLHVPRTAGESEVALRRGYWIRCRVIEGTPQTGFFQRSPRLGGIHVESLGGIANASNMTNIRNEILGLSNGKPGQRFAVAHQPMLPPGERDVLEVEQEDGSGWEPWERVTDFSNSEHEDKHFVVDPVSAEVVLGPSVRSASGAEIRFGATPPAGMHVRLSSYRAGGGPQGNVGQNTLVTLKTSIPYVDTVTNRRVASGGVDPESIGAAKIRGPQALRTRNRAVTSEDFELLAREASPSVRRARCIQPTEVGSSDNPLPGVVRVLIVPTIPLTDGRTVMPDDLRPPNELIDEVRAYLDERRLLTTVLVVSQPEYVWVSVDVAVKSRAGADRDAVRDAVEERLYEFIHPVQGGVDGDGWPFGRNLFASELYSQLQPVRGVEYVQSIKVYPVDPTTGERGEPIDTLEIARAGLLCSFSHRVEVI